MVFVYIVEPVLKMWFQDRWSLVTNPLHWTADIYVRKWWPVMIVICQDKYISFAPYSSLV